MKAMRYFLDENPDAKNIAWLYHTVPNNPRGMPLASIAHKCGLDNIIKFLDSGEYYVYRRRVSLFDELF